MRANDSTRYVRRLHGRLDRTTDGVVAWIHRVPGGHVETIYAPPGQVPPRVSRWSTGHVWASVATFHGRRVGANVVDVPALWVDLDPPDLAAEDLVAWQRATYQRLTAFTPAPSLVVFSGRGWHGYWLFDDPVRVRDNDSGAQQIVDANRALAGRLDGDAVGDVARVMRVPGTINPKTHARCRLLVEDGPIYGFEELLSDLGAGSSPAKGSAVPSCAGIAVGAGGMVPLAVPESLSPVRGRGRPSLGVTLRDLRSVPPWARSLVVGGVWAGKERYRRPGGLDGSRADLAVVGALVRAGWPDARIVAAFGRRDWLIGARYRALCTRGAEYLRRTIAKARRSVHAARDRPRDENVSHGFPRGLRVSRVPISILPPGHRYQSHRTVQGQRPNPDTSPAGQACRCCPGRPQSGTARMGEVFRCWGGHRGDVLSGPLDSHAAARVSVYAQVPP